MLHVYSKDEMCRHSPVHGGPKSPNVTSNPVRIRSCDYCMAPPAIPLKGRRECKGEKSSLGKTRTGYRRMRRMRLSGGDENTERVADWLGCDVGRGMKSLLENADARKSKTQQGGIR
jgi:hypothetical protein